MGCKTDKVYSRLKEKRQGGDDMKDKRVDDNKDDERIRLEDLDLTPSAKTLLMLSGNY